jgi:methylenetetrahydrofolate reductase (NADPH)
VESHPRTATAAVAGALKRRTGIEVVPHLASAAYTKLQLEDFVIDFSYEDLDNIFVIRSDKDPLDSRFRVNPFGHSNAEGLVEQISNLSKGIYHDKFVKEPTPLNFCLGVAAYPEKHQEASSLEEDIKYLKQKVDKGASYIVTQMFFDNEKFYSFVDKCNKIGINVPIIPALKPLSLASHLVSLPNTFSITMPEELEQSVAKVADDKEAVKKVGMEWCLRQTEDLLRQGFPLIHYFTMGRMHDLSKNLREIF